MESFLQYCRNYIVDHIDGYVGQTYYGSDFAYVLTEAPNADGSLTYDRYTAFEYLREWLWEADAYWDYCKDNFGIESLHCPFSDAEGYMVCMVIEGVADLLSQCSVIEKHWNDDFKLTAKAAEKICKEIEDLEIRWTK